MKTYRVHASLIADSRIGDVWCYEKDIKSRLIIIKYGKDSIIVTRRLIDENFEKFYNKKDSKRWFVSSLKNSIVIDSYYREKLGILETHKDYDLTIKKVGKCAIHNHLRYLYQHPNDSIRITFWLAIVSIIVSGWSIVEWICRDVCKFLNLIFK